MQHQTYIFKITVAELKKYLKDATTIPEEQQRLIFQGKALKDKDPISLYCIFCFVVTLLPQL